MGYTKGEWKQMGVHIYADNPKDIHDKIVVVEVNPMGYNEESKANAHLIAAAPDLYEALKQIVSWMEKWRDAEWNFNGLLVDGRKAIAKAEGR